MKIPYLFFNAIVDKTFIILVYLFVNNVKKFVKPCLFLFPLIK